MGWADCAAGAAAFFMARRGRVNWWFATNGVLEDVARRFPVDWGRFWVSG